MVALGEGRVLLVPHREWRLDASELDNETLERVRDSHPHSRPVPDLLHNGCEERERVRREERNGRGTGRRIEAKRVRKTERERERERERPSTGLPRFRS